MKKTFLLVALLALSLGANSCGNSASNAVVPAGENPGTVSLVQLFPSQFVAQTNSFISLEAKVLDGNGMPVPYTPVTFTNLSLTGSLSAEGVNTGSGKAAASTDAVTNGAGIATMRISSTSEGFATIQVEVNAGAGIVRDQKTVFFTATSSAQPSPALILGVDDGDGIPDEPADFTLFKNANDNERTITATVFDGFGRLVAGSTVFFGSDSADATFPNGTTATTDAFGRASVLLKVVPTSLSNLKTTLNITAQADNGAFNMITLFENPVTIAAVTVSANPQAVATGETSDISANVITSAGTPAPDGTTVNFSVTQGGIDPFSQTAGGIATATFTAPSTPGTATIKATVGGVSGSVTVTITAAPTPTPSPTPTPALTVSPATATASCSSGSVAFFITGGVPPYTVTSTNTSLVTVSPASVSASGGLFTATIISGGAGCPNFPGASTDVTIGVKDSATPTPSLVTAKLTVTNP